MRGKVEKDLDREFDNIVEQVESKFNGILGKLNSYTIKNATDSRTIDLDSATLSDLGNFVATFIKDLKEILSK